MTNLIGIRRLADNLDCHINTIRNRVRAGTIRQPFTVPGSDRWVWIEAEIDARLGAPSLAIGPARQQHVLLGHAAGGFVRAQRDAGRS